MGLKVDLAIVGAMSMGGKVHTRRLTYFSLLPA